MVQTRKVQCGNTCQDAGLSELHCGGELDSVPEQPSNIAFHGAAAELSAGGLTPPGVPSPIPLCLPTAYQM